MSNGSAISDDPTVHRLEALEYADYETTGSLARCKKYLDALRRFLLCVMQRGSHGGVGAEDLSYDTKTYENDLERARQWFISNGGADNQPVLVKADFRNFRDEC